MRAMASKVLDHSARERKARQIACTQACVRAHPRECCELYRTVYCCAVPCSAALKSICCERAREWASVTATTSLNRAFLGGAASMGQHLIA